MSGPIKQGENSNLESKYNCFLEAIEIDLVRCRSTMAGGLLPGTRHHRLPPQVMTRTGLRILLMNSNLEFALC